MNPEQWHEKRRHHLDRDETLLATHDSEVVPRDEVEPSDSGSNICPDGNHSLEELRSCCEWAIGHTFNPKSVM